jgi:hypothetical protein
MKKKSTSINLQAEAKIIKALNFLRNNFSKQIGQPWNYQSLYNEVSMTRTFPTILKNMGIIEYPKKGHIKLTEKIDTITPREIHKEINAYHNASQKRNKKLKDKIKAKEIAKIQAQIRFENKQKLRGTIDNSGYKAIIDQDELRMQNMVTRHANTKDNGYQEALRNAVPPPPQAQNLFNVQGAYYPTMNQEVSVKQFLDGIDAVLPRGFKLDDMLKTLKDSMREEIKDELRKEIINELISKG